MNCGICGSEAREIHPNGLDGVSIECPTCSGYDIARTVTDSGMWDGLSKEQKAEALRMARTRTPAGGRPLITSYDK